MIRFVFRALAAIAFTAAILAGLLDASRTVATERIVATPFGADLERALPAQLEAMRGFAAQYPALPTLLEAALQVPAWGVFGALAALLWLVGRRPAPRSRRFVKG